MKILHAYGLFLALIAIVPEYIAMGMLGSRKYLDQYNAPPLEKRREFAKQILKAVDIYTKPVDKDAIRKEAAGVLGLENLTPEQALQLKNALQYLMKLPQTELSRA